jgi:hypothetical protein
MCGGCDWVIASLRYLTNLISIKRRIILEINYKESGEKQTWSLCN